MPLLQATGAGVRHRGRWVFRDLDVVIRPGEIVAVAGPPGSGRTTVLLALVKRFRLTAGGLALTGRAALGHVPGVEEPEAKFTVAEHVRERLALLGRPRGDADDVIAGGLMGLDPRSKGWELTPYERQILGLVLALIERPQIIALDGVEDGLTAREQAALWVELERIARTGVALLVSAREADADRVATIVHLDGARRPAGTGESLVTPALVPPSIGTAGQPAAHPVVVENASRDGEPPDSTPVEDVAAKSAQVDSPSGVGVPAEGASATGAVAEEAQPAGGPADGEVHGGPIDGADDRESGETS